jgi:cyclin E
MEPYFQVLEEDSEYNPLVLLEANDQIKAAYGLAHICPNIIRDDSHIIQTHTTSLDLFVSFFHT